jgi:aminomethyltransferase
MTKQTTPLTQIQTAHGGKMVDFAGWQMPIQFQGILAEHRAVRSAVGIFDVSHMGRLHLAGPGAAGFLANVCCRPLVDLKAGRVRYGLLLADDGGVIDDILVSREAADAFHIVVNAGNRLAVLADWAGLLPKDVTLTDLSAQQAMIAVQGPESLALLATLDIDGRELPKYGFRDVAWRGATVRCSRTGYTGSDGAELFVPAELAESLWQSLREAGALPCGLGARDTLRIEAAMPLYGHELSRGRSPVAAGLTWAVGREPGYRGSLRVLAELAHGPAEQLVGLAVAGRRPAREGYTVLHQGVPVGSVSSGTFSPTLEKPIAMAFVPTRCAALGTALEVDLRGTTTAATVVPLPFWKRA